MQNASRAADGKQKMGYEKWKMTNGKRKMCSCLLVRNFIGRICKVSSPYLYANSTGHNATNCHRVEIRQKILFATRF